MYTASNEALRMLLWNAIGAASFIGWNAVCGTLIFGFLKVEIGRIVLSTTEYLLSSH